MNNTKLQPITKLLPTTLLQLITKLPTTQPQPTTQHLSITPLQYTLSPITLLTSQANTQSLSSSTSKCLSITRPQPTTLLQHIMPHQSITKHLTMLPLSTTRLLITKLCTPPSLTTLNLLPITLRPLPSTTRNQSTLLLPVISSTPPRSLPLPSTTWTPHTTT